MESTRRNARVAGFLYLLITLAAPIRLIYIPNKLFRSGDATTIAANIVAHERLFRLGMVSDLFSGIVVILLTLALYRLFKDVDQGLAVLVVILGGVIPGLLDFVMLVNDGAALILARGPEFLSVFDKPQRDALALFFVRVHHQQVLAAEMFWGLWLLPFGALVIRSGFLPRFLGWWLIVNGVAYVAISLAGLLAPAWEERLFTWALPAMLGELAIMLWLLIVGARAPRTSVAAAPA